MYEKLSRIADALRARSFDADVFMTAKEAADFILRDIPANQEIGISGCATVAQIGLADALRSAGHTVHWHQGVPAAKSPAIRRQALLSPYYLASANAITEDGLIVQIDGTGNRVAALCYGPSTVYMIIGRNKVVAGGYQQAVHRIKSVACPQNARRLGLDTPCASTGSCNAAACKNPMCRMFLTLERAPGGKRTQILLVNEDLGF